LTDRPDSNDSSQDSVERDFETRRQGAVYQGAFEAVIALLVAVFTGYWLDGYFDTTPVLLLVGFVIGFTSFTVRLVRLGRWVEESTEANSKSGSDDSQHRIERKSKNENQE
jgi:F0F1-type ATP synthase assembly protein I